MVYTRYAEKQHALWRNLGSRFTNCVADRLIDKPKGLYLSSFRCLSAFMAEAVTAYAGPFPYIDGLLMQATQNIGSIEVEHLPRARRPQQLHASPAGAAVAQHVRELLGDAAALSTLAGFALSLLGLFGFAGWSAKRCFARRPQGWASLVAAVLLLSGVQLLILGLIGEYLGRLYLTMNGKPQSIVKEVLHSDLVEPAPRPAAERTRRRPLP